MSREGKFLVLPVDWVQARFDTDPVPPMVLLPLTWGLTVIDDPVSIENYKKDLEVETFDPFGKGPPDEEEDDRRFET